MKELHEKTISEVFEDFGDCELKEGWLNRGRQWAIAIVKEMLKGWKKDMKVHKDKNGWNYYCNCSWEERHEDGQNKSLNVINFLIEKFEITEEELK